ncbi:MAG: sporulation initiation factor Spo0A C-terminal domain-containing protein [Blautia sp.]|nr:sporulation initiation factor Spo0A C-terminal domain-containing protein [Blautia sp.]
MNEIYITIRQLGVSTKYKGYYYVADAVKLTLESQERPIRITKDIYPILATKYQSKPQNIEHNIRTVVLSCWRSNREKLEEVMGVRLHKMPSNYEFLDGLSYYILHLREASAASRARQ